MAKQKKDPNFPMQGKRGGMGGTYGSKSTNLSMKQLKAAGAAKAAGKRTVSISQTRREGSRTLGPGGKPLTGTVILLDGSKAVYKAGRRVQAADARKPKAPVARPQGTRPGGATTKATPPTVTKRAASGLSAAQREKMGKGRTDWKSGARRPSSSGGYTPGAGTGSRRSTSPTVSADVAAGRAAGPRDTRTPAEKAYDSAKAALADWRKKKLVTPADMAKEREKRRLVQQALERVRAEAARKKK